MRSAFVALVCLACVFVSSSTRAQAASDADPRPRSGLGGLIVGYGGLSFAVFNLATVPLCDLYPPDAQDVCIGMSVTFIVGGVIAAIPGIIIGHSRRREYKEWRERQTTGLRFETADVSLLGERPGLRLRFSF
jgi:hypothetical protein